MGVIIFIIRNTNSSTNENYLNSDWKERFQLLFKLLNVDFRGSNDTRAVEKDSILHVRKRIPPQHRYSHRCRSINVTNNRQAKTKLIVYLFCTVQARRIINNERVNLHSIHHEPTTAASVALIRKCSEARHRQQPVTISLRYDTL